MRNLFFLLYKYGGLISFVVLQFICFSFIINNNDNQKAIYDNTTQQVTGYFYNTIDQWTRFLKMSDIADTLAAENARLRAQLSNARFVNTILRDSTMSSDSTQQYTYMSARVTRNMVNSAHNFIRINHGTDTSDKVRKGVIAADGQNGIVGIVVATSDHHSKVMSLLNRNCRVSVKFKKNNEFGSLLWRGFDPRTFRMEDVPKYVDVAVGDTIVTSGYSDLFPKDLLVGTVDSQWNEPGSNVHGISVRLVNDLRRLEYVYVVNNLMRQDIEKLEGSNSKNE